MKLNLIEDGELLNVSAETDAESEKINEIEKELKARGKKIFSTAVSKTGKKSITFCL